MIPKAQENISEYILFLWQLEDLLRAFQYDLESVEEKYIRHAFKKPEEQQEVMSMLYILLEEMKKEEEAVTHAKSTKGSMLLLEKVHAYLRDEEEDKMYLALVSACDEVVADFLKNKADEKSMPFTEICINIMYGILTLRLRKMPITPQTQEASDKVKECLKYLSKTFAKMNKEG
tara:strand:- start:33542 stop:34066 length:525 start_codon:yes stop_codon:yes gene_type:complete